MRMFCGRSDAEPENQGEKIPGWSASIRRGIGRAINYNRLDFRLPGGLIPESALLTIPGAQAQVISNGGGDTQMPGNCRASWRDLFLTHERKSCIKQVWGVTRCGRGIAL